MHWSAMELREQTTVIPLMQAQHAFRPSDHHQKHIHNSSTHTPRCLVPNCSRNKRLVLYHMALSILSRAPEVRLLILTNSEELLRRTSPYLQQWLPQFFSVSHCNAHQQSTPPDNRSCVQKRSNTTLSASRYILVRGTFITITAIFCLLSNPLSHYRCQSHSGGEADG